jgi:Uncharacterized protein conserved in bacteria
MLPIPDGPNGGAAIVAREVTAQEGSHESLSGSNPDQLVTSTFFPCSRRAALARVRRPEPRHRGVSIWSG